MIRDATTARDLLQFTLSPDAATDVPDWEIDYLNDNGIHQIRPASGDFCPIRLTLSDTATSPVNGVPNSNFVGNPYEALNATYTQKSTEQLLQVRVSNVPEAVPDYFFVSSNREDRIRLRWHRCGARRDDHPSRPHDRTFR